MTKFPREDNLFFDANKTDKEIEQLKRAVVTTQATTEYTFNVLNYGAIMDGVTDSTDALLSAVADAESVNGTVIIPLGSLVISDRVEPSASISIIGEGSAAQGSGATGQTYDPASKIISNTSEEAFLFSALNGVRLENLSIEAPTASIGVKWDGMLFSGITNVHITVLEADAIALEISADDNATFNTAYCEFDRLFLTAPTGLRMTNSPSAARVVSHNKFGLVRVKTNITEADGTEDSIILEGGNDNTFENVIVTQKNNATGAGIRFGPEFYDNVFLHLEAGTQAGLYVETPTVDALQSNKIIEYTTLPAPTLELGANLDEIEDEVPPGLEPIGVGLMTRFKYDLASGTILFLGDSTGAEVVYNDPYPKKTAQWLADRFPAYTVNYYLWNEGSKDYVLDTVMSTGTGDNVIDVYNGCASGERIPYHLGENYENCITNVEPDLCFVGHGHNQGDPDPAERFREDLMNLTEQINYDFPGCEIVLIVQNPHFYHDHPTYAEGERDILRDQFGFVVWELCMQQGYGFINVWQAFFDYCDNDEDAIMALLDDAFLHPLEEGQVLWTTQITNRLRISNNSMPKPQNPSTLSVASKVWAPDPFIEEYEFGGSTILDLGTSHEGIPRNGLVVGGSSATPGVLAGTRSTDFVPSASGYIDAAISETAYVAPFAFCAYVNRDTNSGVHVVFGGLETDAPIMQYGSGNNNIVFDPQLGVASNVSFTGAGAIATWQKLFLYYDGTNAKLYINGVLINTLAISDGFSTTPGNIQIGRRGNGTGYWDGKMQHVAFFPSFAGGVSAAASAASAIASDPNNILDYDPFIYYALNTPAASAYVPTEWIPSGNCTAVQSLASGTFETKSMSLKTSPTAASAGSAYVTTLIEDDEIIPLLGGWINFAARRNATVDDDNSGFVGRVQITLIGDAVDDIPPSISNSVQTGLDGFRWVNTGIFVPKETQGIRLFLIANRNSSGSAEAYWDRVHLSKGKMIRDPLSNEGT